MNEQDADDRAPLAGSADQDPAAVGMYALIERIGAGSFGIVYRAISATDNSIYAVKLLNRQLAMNPDVVARYRREARLLAALDHPNIVRLYEADEWGGHHFIVMEYVDGCDVLHHASAKPLTPHEAASIVKDAARACHWAHTRQRPVIHRDIKPSNILIESATKRVLLTDFGLAKELGASTASSDAEKRIGTLMYMAPEQIDASRGTVDPRTDVYALGATLYHLLTGRPPFPLGDYDAYAAAERQILWDPPRRPAVLCKGLDSRLETICRKCLQKEPVDRYPTAAALAEDLERYLSGKPLLGRLPGPIRRVRAFCHRRPIIAAALAIGLLATAVAGVALPYAARQRQQAMIAAQQAMIAAQQATIAAQKTAQEHEARRVSDLFRYDGQIRSAFAAWIANQPDRVTEFLRQCPDQDRDWEWSYVDGLRHSGGDILPTQEPVAGAAFSPDGRRFVTIGPKGVARVWAASPGTPGSPGSPATETRSAPTSGGTSGDGGGGSGETWNSHASPYSPIRFSPDGSKVITCDPGAGQLFIWDCSTGKAIEHPPFDAYCHIRDVSYDGQYCVVVGPRMNVPTLTIREVFTGKPLISITPSSFGTAHFSLDGSRVAACNPFSGRIEVFSTATGAKICDVENTDAGITRFALNREMVAVAFGDGTLSIWNADTGAEIWTTRPHDNQITSIDITSNGIVLTAAKTGPVMLTDVKGRRVARVFRGQSNAFFATISPDGKQVLTTGREPQVLLWHTDAPQAFVTFRAQAAFGMKLALSPDGRTLVAASVKPPCTVWDAVSLKQVATFSNYKDAVTGLAFSNTSTVVSAGTDGSLHTWNPATGVEIAKFSGGAGPLVTMATMPTLDRILTANATVNASLTLWDLASQRALRTDQSTPAVVRQIWANPHSQQALLLLGGGVLNILDIASLRTIKSLHEPAAFSAAAYMADGNGILTANGRQLRLWDHAAEHVLREFVGRNEIITVIAPMPNGKRIVTGGDDGTVRLWDVATGQDLMKLPGPTAGIEAIVVSPDGSTIFAGSEDGYVTVWRIPT